METHCDCIVIDSGFVETVTAYRLAPVCKIHKMPFNTARESRLESAPPIHPP